MAIATGQYTIIDLNDVDIATTPPLNPVEDQLWLDTSVVPNVLKRWGWDGVEEKWDWIKASPTDPDDIGAATEEYVILQAELAYFQALADAEEAAEGMVSAETEARIAETVANITALQEYIEELAAEAEESAREDAVEEIRNEMSQYLHYDQATGLTLGATNSPSQTVYDNEAVQFLYHGEDDGESEFVPHSQAVAYIHRRKMFIENVEATKSFMVGVHELKRHLNTDVTLIRWVGKEGE